MPASGEQSRGGRRGRFSRGGPRWLFHPVRHHPSHTSAIPLPAQRCPTSPFPDNSLKRALKSPSGGVEPPRRLNLPASASNPTLSGPPFLLSRSFFLSFFASTISIGSISLSHPLLLRVAEKKKHEGKNNPPPSLSLSVSFSRGRRCRRRSRGLATPRSILPHPLPCRRGLLRAPACTATGHCDYAA